MRLLSSYLYHSIIASRLVRQNNVVLLIAYLCVNMYVLCRIYAGNVPLETMEQHVFRTYEAKYGLRSIAVEHAGALLRSLLKHSSTDNEVRSN